MEADACTYPYHADIIRRKQDCTACHDVRYQDAEELERLKRLERYEQLRLAAMPAPTISIEITDEMVQRALDYYYAHMYDPVPSQDWMRGVLQAALRP